MWEAEQKRMRELHKILKEASKAYYANDEEIMSNFEYDKLYDELVELTALEYRLLLIFAGNRGILLTRNQILEKIWDSAGNFVEDNTLTVYVKRLREKLGKNINIETVRGIGYRVD